MFKPVRPLVLISFAALAATPRVSASTDAEYIRASGAQCFRANNVSRFMPGPPGFVIVRTEDNRWFQLHLSPGCPDFRLIMKIGIRPHDSQWLCEGKADELDGLPPGDGAECVVNEIRQLPPGAVPGTI